MVKVTLGLLYLFVSILPVTATAPTTIVHLPKKNKVMKSGIIRISNNPLNDREFILKVDYQFKPRGIYRMIPKKNRRGSLSQAIPNSFLTQLGYDNLARRGSMEDSRIKVKFLGRETVGQYYDTYKIRIFPKKANWDAIAYYHPDIKGVGFAKLIVNLKKLPIVKKLQVVSYLKE